MRLTWEVNTLIALSLVLLTICVFARAFTLKSEFKFSASDKVVEYVVQSFWKNKYGRIPISSIDEVIIQDSQFEGSRTALVARQEVIPMSLTYSKTINCEKIKQEISKWVHEYEIA